MYFLKLYKLNFEYLIRVARALDTVTTTCLCPFLRCCFKPRAKSRKKTLHTFSSCNKYAKSSVKPSRVLLDCLLFNCRVAMAGGALRAKTLANSIQLLLSVLCHFCQLKWHTYCLPVNRPNPLTALLAPISAFGSCSFIVISNLFHVTVIVHLGFICNK